MDHCVYAHPHTHGWQRHVISADQRRFARQLAPRHGINGGKFGDHGYEHEHEHRVVQAQSVLKAKFLKSGSINYVNALYKRLIPKNPSDASSSLRLGRKQNHCHIARKWAEISMAPRRRITADSRRRDCERRRERWSGRYVLPHWHVVTNAAACVRTGWPGAHRRETHRGRQTCPGMM